jgi:hypothetical protein
MDSKKKITEKSEGNNVLERIPNNDQNFVKISIIYLQIIIVTETLLLDYRDDTHLSLRDSTKCLNKF